MPTRCNRGFYCRSYCLLNMFRAPLCPKSGARVLYSGCCLWCFVLWFSSCWSGTPAMDQRILTTSNARGSSIVILYMFITKWLLISQNSRLRIKRHRRCFDLRNSHGHHIYIFMELTAINLCSMKARCFRNYSGAGTSNKTLPWICKYSQNKGKVTPLSASEGNATCCTISYQFKTHVYFYDKLETLQVQTGTVNHIKSTIDGTGDILNTAKCLA